MSKFLPKHHFIFSVENPVYPAKHQATTEEVAKFLNSNGEDAQIIHGHYGGKPERSILVSNPMNLQGLHQMATDFGQESVLHSQNGKHALKYLNGPQAGQSVTGEGTNYFRDKPEVDHSTFHTVDGPVHFTHNLNFSPEPAQPTSPVKKSEIETMEQLAQILEAKDDSEEIHMHEQLVHMWSVPFHRWAK